MKLTAYLTLEGYGEVEVNGTATPGRPAPPCSNPDSPAFSDSGDPAEAEVMSVIAPDASHDYLGNPCHADVLRQLSPEEVIQCEAVLIEASQEPEGPEQEFYEQSESDEEGPPW